MGDVELFGEAGLRCSRADLVTASRLDHDLRRIVDLYSTSTPPS